MNTRRDFIQSAIAVAGSLAVASQVAQAVEASTQGTYIPDRLVDSTGKYVLLPLPYVYDALEPVIDARTVELHYQFHHKPAVVAANKAEENLTLARESGD